MKSYLSINDLIQLIDEPMRTSCMKLIKDNEELIYKAHGSSHNHQAWPGGYADHIKECMNIGMKMYELLFSLRPLPFTMSDVLLILFLHDIEKPWKYGNKINKCDENFLLTKEDKHNFRVNKLKEYNIKLTPDQVNAFKYTEGELCDYTSKKRVMNQLAGLCHLADITSARIWHDYPKQTEDPWSAI